MFAPGISTQAFVRLSEPLKNFLLIGSKRGWPHANQGARLLVSFCQCLNPGEFPPQSPQTVSLCMYLECRLSPWFCQQIKSNSSDLTCKFGVWLTQYFRVKLTRKMLTEQASSVLQDSLSSFDYLCRRSDFLSGMFQPHYNKTSPWKQLLLAIQIREILDQVTDPPKQALLITQGFSIQP
jgi:hypothetical protein